MRYRHQGVSRYSSETFSREFKYSPHLDPRFGSEGRNRTADFAGKLRVSDRMSLFRAVRFAALAVGIAMLLAPTFARATSGPVPVTPQDYGAACDGSSDDSVHLQNWLNALGTVAVSGSPVYAGFIPGGTCTFASPLVAPATNAISISGTGLGSQLRYIGTSTTATALKFGSTNGGCSISSLTLSKLLLSSATKMTAGAAIEFDDVCGLRLQDVAIEDNAGGASGNWANGIIEKGGNQHYLRDNTVTGSIQPILMYGDDASHSSRQLTDPRIVGGILSGGIVGVDIAGNVGGATIDGVDILSNQTEIRISQDSVSIPNAQIVLGPTMFLDKTSGGVGRGLDVEDLGGANSILMLQGTWIASAGTDCMYIASNVNYVIQWNGGKLINCGTNGINNQSSVVKMTVSNVIVNMTLAGFLGNSGYGFLCQNYNVNDKYIDIDFQSVTGSGPYSPNCYPRSYVLSNNQSVYTKSASVNIAPPTTFWQDDVSPQTPISIANGASVPFPTGSGEIIVNEINSTGDVATYNCGGGACTLLGSTRGIFVASTTTPASGHYSVAFNGSAYALYNNYGQTENFTVKLIRTRNGL